MSDTVHVQTGNGVTQAPPAKKRRIASSSFDGHIGKIEFATGEIVEIDATKIPDSIGELVKAYGAISVIQTAYSASDAPVEAAQAMVKRLYSGDWRPGLPRRQAEPAILTQALATHLKKPPEFIDEVWLPAYAKKHGLDLGSARRKVRAHGDIAGLIAKITAERAAAAAAHAKKVPRESLDLTL
jgi:hypothetical protein